MADRDIFVVEPADNQNLLSLEECKLFLNISGADTSRDAQLELQIAAASAMIADMANRKPELGFGETRVIEEWREVMHGRVQVMHFPISQDEPITVNANGAPYIEGTHYRVDFNSGKVSVGVNGGNGAWPQPVILEYTGGYLLPDDAPLPLKQACAALVRGMRITNQTASVAGMRQIKHKEAQVSFYDPNALLIKSAGMQSSPGMQEATALIRPYIRIEV